MPNVTDIRREETYRELVGNQDAATVISNLSNSVSDNYWDIGAILYYIKTKEIYKQNERYNLPGHSGWRPYCDVELTVGYRTAQYWINIYQYFTDMEIDKERIKEIGWHKIKLLVNVTKNPMELEALLASARDMSLEELKASITQFKVTEGTDNREVTTYRKFTYILPEAQGETVETILATALKVSNNSLNEAFFKIAVEWWQENLPQLIADGHYVPPVEQESPEMEVEEANIEEETNTDEVIVQPSVSKPTGLGSFAGLAAEFPEEYGVEV